MPVQPSASLDDVDDLLNRADVYTPCLRALQVNMALQKLSSECGMGDVLPRMWVQKVRQ